MTRADFDRAIGLVFSGSQAHQVCNEYIKSLEAELEALQQPKSCEGCKYDFTPNFILNNVGDKIDICYMCSRLERLDRYEAKEQ